MGQKNTKNTNLEQEEIRARKEHEHDHDSNQNVNPTQKKQATCCGCFGGNRSKDHKHKSSVTGSRRGNQGKSTYAHDTKKSSIVVRNQPNAKIQQKLFENRQKRLLQIKMKRAQPYEILKDSDYFDSELNDKHDLQRLKKVYENCEIANYQTPQTEKLQTVQVKTYLFDRNLTKLDA